MKMRLTVLGSGAAVIRKDRSSAAFLLEADNQILLFDCGWGCPEKLLKVGCDIQKIDHILISHPHADHIGSLMNILQSMLVSGYGVSGPGYLRRRRSKTLYLHGYRGFAKHYEILRGIMVPEREEPYRIEVIEHPPTKTKFGNLTITSAEVKHVPQFWNSAAFRVDYNDKSLIYSGDSSYDENLVRLSKGASIALYEASIPIQMYRKSGSRPNHLSPFECGLLAQRANAKKLVLVHMFGNDSKERIEKEVRKSYSGPLIISRDMQHLSL